jgi:hypothetical protein
MPADKPAGRNIIFFESYKGLPDYEKNPPFNVTEMKIHRELKNLLSTINTPTKECVAKEVNVPNSQNFPLKTNICDSSDFDKILALVIRLAPTLDKKNLTFWKIDVDQDGESKLLIGYIDISKDKHFQYPYLSLWLLKFIDNRYKATYAGPFLSGTIHAIRQFGQDAKNNMVFVQHLSCIECHPWVYLTIIDFSKQPEGAFFEFTYSETHSNFKPTIEYELPGMGHSVDAKVESRVPNPPNVEGPHLIQNFKLEDGTEEWWEFTCKGYKCDYNFSKGYAPEKLYKLWKGADKL